MSPAVYVLLGFALACPGLVYLARELRVSQDRLLAAREQGIPIPPRVDEIPPFELPPLPAELQPFVEAWESAGSKAAEEARIRKWLGEGWKPARIAKYLADPPVPTT